MTELLSALIGAVAGALAAAWLYTREARRQLKIDSLRRFVSNRFDPTGLEFTQALNEALVVFADSPAVIRAIDDLRKGSDNPKLVTLYRAMSDAARIPHAMVTNELFLTGFNARTTPDVVQSERSVPRFVPPAG